MPPNPTADAAYKDARENLSTSLAILYALKARGHTGGDLVVELGASLVRACRADVFNTATIAAIALMELDVTLADLAAVADVAADARTHWPTDHPRMVHRTTFQSGQITGPGLDRDTARGVEQVEGLDDPPARLTLADIAPGETIGATIDCHRTDQHDAHPHYVPHYAPDQPDVAVYCSGEGTAVRGAEHVEAQRMWARPPASSMRPARYSSTDPDTHAERLDVLIGQEHAKGNHAQCTPDWCLTAKDEAEAKADRDREAAHEHDLGRHGKCDPSWCSIAAGRIALAGEQAEDAAHREAMAQKDRADYLAEPDPPTEPVKMTDYLPPAGPDRFA